MTDDRKSGTVDFAFYKEKDADNQDIHRMKNVPGRGPKGRLLRFQKACGLKNGGKRWLLGSFVFGVGFLGAILWFPFERGSFVAEAENGKLTVDAEVERCRWRKDVEFFIVLGNDGKLPTKEEFVCETPKMEDVSAAGKPDFGDEELKTVIKELSAGYPLEKMASAIARYDREVAALIVGIAKKESNWGKRSPRAEDGSDCFNYWGWKGAGSRGIAMGHGCFGNPEEAVQAVGDRLTELVKLRETSDPKNLVVWKCGSSCATHSKESVRKWISDVDLYYKKIAKK